MSRIDLDAARLQYEILNVPIATLAERLGVPADLLAKEARDKKWTPIWSDTDTLKLPDELEDGEDEFTFLVEAYSSQARKKLQAYSLAKELLLAQKYLEIEIGILNKTKDALDTLPDLTPASIKLLSAIYKDMVKGLSVGGNMAVSVGSDEDGIPTAIIRDLSGQGRR